MDPKEIISRIMELFLITDTDNHIDLVWSLAIILLIILILFMSANDFKLIKIRKR